MSWFRPLVSLPLVVVLAVIAIFVGVDRGDLYTPCTQDGDPDGGLVRAMIICAWVVPMGVVAYVVGAWAARKPRPAA